MLAGSFGAAALFALILDQVKLPVTTLFEVE